MRASGRVRLAGALIAGFLGTSCFNFHLVGSDEPEPFSPPNVVSVTVEYHQDSGCTAPPDRCDDAVIFWGSWMAPGAEFTLQKDAEGYIWRGTAYAVPVNFPPKTGSYAVRVFDPRLLDTESLGLTAQRLAVGGQFLRVMTGEGTPQAFGWIYIDSNGQGRNPF